MKRIALILLLWCWSALAQAAGLFLWEVQGPKARHYLVGSVHLLPPSAYPLPPAFDAAYAAAEGLVFETDIAELATPEVQGRLLAAAREGRPIRAQIKPALYDKLARRAREIGMPVETCDGFKPWFCALSLELFAVQRAGFEAENGVDQHFFNRAAADGKPVTWLESPETQAGFFTAMPEALSTQLLAATLDEATDTSQDPDELLGIWKNGDLRALDALVRELKSRYPELYARLFANRNKAWVPRLAELFKGDRPQLVVVGAAHYAGPDGLLALLKSAGLNARPVSAEPEKAMSTTAKDPRAPGAPYLAPFLYLHDADAAYAWYQKAFGFAAGMRMDDGQGRLQHGELRYRDMQIMLGPEGGPYGQRSPKSGKFTAPFNLYIYVDDVDAFARKAQAAGAEVLQAPKDEFWGDRVAVLRDPEGYLWWFATHRGE